MRMAIAWDVRKKIKLTLDNDVGPGSDLGGGGVPGSLLPKCTSICFFFPVPAFFSFFLCVGNKRDNLDFQTVYKKRLQNLSFKC